MATFLVTGGCGFIGSHLCAALRARGHGVRVLDDLSSGSEANLAPGSKFLLGDVCQPMALREALAGVDGCFHLAAIASVQRGEKDWLGTHRTNLSATVALLEAARASRIPVVYASSAAVYGANGNLPLHEDSTVQPLSAYGADKLGCELHARVAGHVHGIPTMGLRFFNVFGPRQDPASPYSGVISIFCDRLLRKEALDVFGDGQQTRDFIFVEDVVRALIAAMRQVNVAAPVLNICTGNGTSVLQLAYLVAELCGVRAEINHRPARAGEVRHSIGLPLRARERLGLGSTMAIRDGLEATLTWMREGRPGLAPTSRSSVNGRTPIWQGR
ncbi:NAD-dependent epimerase/dehydratase family protein [Pararoseomonas indoligenes]|uniref:NAD-dependent epimerase/dehydratase family protein n=1 Tax=Roseomonas indoligenes TaxID=2820811 RepID=A0A940SAE4_9PROT|nr:NAD-dependent epimerase/dehydratase family protein [Pararoseomonas indoligenes]MBP0496107.1 NAD-dependent epimerase/dehydratase family protein [Pararoseomonas indoligenes]